MPILEKSDKCCGCAACLDICPRSAISMIEDEETFLYPLINNSLCIKCNLCEKVCPLNFDNFSSKDKIRSFVGTCLNSDIVESSSSGGAFFALCKVFIERGYKIYGVKYNQHFKVVHDCAESIEMCNAFQKSKYVQSNMIGIFKKISEDIHLGKKVLFSGVSCQVAALLSYINVKKISNEQLITVNLLCHGVPSQKMFDKYILEEEKKENSLVSKYNFRNKETNDQVKVVNSRTSYIEFENGNKYIKSMNDDAFLKAYYTRLFYRPSCSTCRFAKEDRISDFTIADAWGIEEIISELNPIQGVSLILLNNTKAASYLNDIQKYMQLVEVSSEWALSSQLLFREPTKMHKNRSIFFKRYRRMSFNKAVFKSTRSYKRVVGRFIPTGLKKKIKSVMHIG